MGFENLDIAQKEKNSIYPERVFAAVDVKIEKLKKIESGEIKKLNLNEAERIELECFEDELGEKLEKIWEIKVNTASFYQNYFLTSEGRQKFKEVVGVDIAGNSEAEISKFLLENRIKLDQADSKKLSDLSGESEKYNDEEVLRNILETRNDDCEIDISNIENPKRTYVILNPNKSLEKIKQLRGFKNEIKKLSQEVENGGDGDLQLAKQNVVTLYRRRVNEMIAGMFYGSVWAKNVGDILGEETLTPEESELRMMFAGLQQFERTYARFDKLLHGAGAEYDDKGMRLQIDAEIKKMADEQEKLFIECECAKEEKIAARGLDSKKIFENRDISKELFSNWAEDVLELYGEKSSQGAEEYDKKRPGPAPDEKWQFVANEEFKSMATNSKQRIVKSSIKNKTIFEALVTLLGHEVGHVVQNLNQQKIPLRLFKKVAGDRVDVFAEMGAVCAEGDVSRELFGVETVNHPHYVRAMTKRTEGGNYLECAKAFYDSALKVIQEKRKQGLISQKKFLEESEHSIRIAINRAKRLFHACEDYSSSNGILTKSKDTIYLEQYFIANHLMDTGLEKYLFIRGINFDTLAILAETGLINLGELKSTHIAKEYALRIWEQEKHKYALSE